MVTYETVFSNGIRLKITNERASGFLVDGRKLVLVGY
jgi:hypothetical protein